MLADANLLGSDPPMRARQNSGIRRKNSYGVKPDLQAAGLLVSAEADKQPSTMRFGARRTPPPLAFRRSSNSRRLHRPHAVPGSAKSQRCRRPLDQTERGQTVSISHRAARWSPHDMLRLELMVVFAWRFARTTVAAYVVDMARRIPHVLRCQMTQVEPSER